MNYLICVAIALVMAGPALSETFVPSLFRVTGVASNDVLNIRDQPNARSAILSAYPFDAEGIEVVGYNETGRWAKVGLGERNGWVSARFLSADGRPASLKCLGAEPFWSLTIDSPDARYKDIETPQITLNAVKARSTLPDAAGISAFDLDGIDLSISTIIRPQQCSDGMSDRMFGWGVDLILRRGPTEADGSGPLHQTGCCTLQGP